MLGEKEVDTKKHKELPLRQLSESTEMHYVLENYIDGRGYLNLSPEGEQARLMAHEIVNNLDLA